MKRWMLLGLLACACGSSDNNGTPDAGFPTGTGTITGTVNGQQLVVRDAVFGIDAAFMTLVMADRTHVCELLGGNTLPSGQTVVLGLALAQLGRTPDFGRPDRDWRLHLVRPPGDPDGRTDAFTRALLERRLRDPDQL